MIGLGTMFSVYGDERGFSLFKYMDTHCLLALVLVSLTMGFWQNNWLGSIVTFAGFNIIGLVVLKKLKIPNSIN